MTYINSISREKKVKLFLKELNMEKELKENSSSFFTAVPLLFSSIFKSRRKMKLFFFVPVLLSLFEGVVVGVFIRV